jgi:hypothetical protein
MKIYNIKTPKNIHDTWDKPESIENLYINQFIKKEKQKNNICFFNYVM